MINKQKLFFITLNEKTTTTTARQMPMKGYMHTLINKKRRRKESVNKQKNYCNNMCMISVSLYMEEEGRERKSVCAACDSMIRDVSLSNMFTSYWIFCYYCSTTYNIRLSP